METELDTVIEGLEEELAELLTTKERQRYERASAAVEEAIEEQRRPLYRQLEELRSSLTTGSVVERAKTYARMRQSLVRGLNDVDAPTGLRVELDRAISALREAERTSVDYVRAQYIEILQSQIEGVKKGNR